MDAIRAGNESLAMHFVTEYPNTNLVELTFEEDEENDNNKQKSIHKGDSTLHVAVRNGDTPLIVYLLTNGLSPNLQNRTNGETALHTAVRTRDVRVCTILTKYGADAKITNNNYETPMVLASENKDYDIIELLAADTQDVIRNRLMSDAEDDDDDANLFADELLDKASQLPQYDFDPMDPMEAADEMDMDAYLGKHQAHLSDHRTFDQN